MMVLVALIPLLIAVIPSEGLKIHSSLRDCNLNCTGAWDASCQGSGQSFVCKCAGGYYQDVDKQACESDCDQLYWSWFTTGDCNSISQKQGSCRNVCQFRVRWWTTGFIIVLFVASVLTIFFMLPLCISSCTACISVKKEQKERKKANGAVGNANDNYAATSYDGAGTMIPAKSAGQPGMGYNPYMYYNPYLYSR